MKVADVMTREVVSVRPGASLKQAAQLLVEHRISGLPVVDDENHVLGVFSEADVLPKETAGVFAQQPLAWLTGFDIEVDRSKLDAHVVGEAMTSPALTIEADDAREQGGRLMSERAHQPAARGRGGEARRDRDAGRPRPGIRPQRRRDRAGDPRGAGRSRASAWSSTASRSRSRTAR